MDEKLCNKSNELILKKNEDKNEEDRGRACLITATGLASFLCGLFLLFYYGGKFDVHKTSFKFDGNYKIFSDHDIYTPKCESITELYGICYYNCDCYKTKNYYDAVDYGKNNCDVNTTLNGYIYKTYNDGKECIKNNPNKKEPILLYVVFTISTSIFIILVIQWIAICIYS